MSNGALPCRLHVSLSPIANPAVAAQRRALPFPRTRTSRLSSSRCFRTASKLVLWDDPNPWRDAWSQVPMPRRDRPSSRLPLGGVGDLTAIDAEQARSGDAAGADRHRPAQRRRRSARRPRQRRGAGRSARRARHQHQALSPRAADRQPHRQHRCQPGESDDDFFKRAVGVASPTSSTRGLPHAQPSTRRPASPPPCRSPASGDWIELRRRLVAVPGIRTVDLLSLNRQKPESISSSSAIPTS